MKFLDLDNENEKEVVYHLYCRAVKKEYRSCDRITRNTSATISNYFKSDKFCFCANFTKIITDQLNCEKYEQRKKKRSRGETIGNTNKKQNNLPRQSSFFDEGNTRMNANENSEEETNKNISMDSDNEYLTDVDSDTNEVLAELITRRDNEDSSIASPLHSVISPGTTSPNSRSSSLASLQPNCTDPRRLCPLAPADNNRNIRKGRKEKIVERFVAIENKHKNEMRKKVVN